MIKILMAVLMLFGPITCMAQEYYPLSEQELLNITNKIQTLQRSDSLKTEIIEEQNTKILILEHIIELDSLEISYKSKTIDALKERNKQPWYENEHLWFIYGVAMVLGSSWVVKNTLQ